MKDLADARVANVLVAAISSAGASFSRECEFELRPRSPRAIPSNHHVMAICRRSVAMSFGHARWNGDRGATQVAMSVQSAHREGTLQRQLVDGQREVHPELPVPPRSR